MLCTARDENKRKIGIDGTWEAVSILFALQRDRVFLSPGCCPAYTEKPPFMTNPFRRLADPQEQGCSILKDVLEKLTLTLLAVKDKIDIVVVLDLT